MSTKDKEVLGLKNEIKMLQNRLEHVEFISLHKQQDMNSWKFIAKYFKEDARELRERLDEYEQPSSGINRLLIVHYLN